MKPKIILFVFFLFISIYGQTQNVDSLVNVLKTKELTTAEQLDLYEKIGRYYVGNNIGKAIEYSEKGLALADKEKNKLSAANFSKYLGIVYSNKSSFDTSRVYFNRSLEYAIDARNKKAEVAAYGSLGNLHKVQQNYQSAVEYYMKALSICDEVEDGDIIKASTLVNLGIVHRAMNNYDRSISFLEQAKIIAIEKNILHIIMTSNHALGTVYADRKEYGKAEALMFNSLEISRKLNNAEYEILSTMSLSSIFTAKKEYDNALKYAQEGLRIAEEYRSTYKILGAWITLSTVYMKQGRYLESEAMALKAWQVDSTSVGEGAYIALNIAVANIHLGNKEKAEDFVWKYQDIMAKGNEKSLHNSIADMEIKYETEKKELRIASLEKEKQLYTWLGIAGVLFAATLGIVLWQNIRNARREKQLIATRSVMDGEMGERTRLARDLHDRLSGNLSAVKIELNNAESLLNVSEKLDSCIEEVRRVAHNLMPVSLQFGMRVALDDFAAQFPNVHFYFFGEEKRLEGRVEFIVYCCANELVNNSLRHSGAKNINMQLIQDGKYVSLTVQDDGCGFDVKIVGQGIGLKNIRDRVASCNGRIDMISSPDKGTETIIELKAKNAGT